MAHDMAKLMTHSIHWRIQKHIIKQNLIYFMWVRFNALQLIYFRICSGDCCCSSSSSSCVSIILYFVALYFSILVTFDLFPTVSLDFFFYPHFGWISCSGKFFGWLKSEYSHSRFWRVFSACLGKQSRTKYERVLHFQFSSSFSK